MIALFLDRFLLADPLKPANKDDGAKRRYFHGLDVGAAMSYGQSTQYVNRFIFAPDELSASNFNQRSVSLDTWLWRIVRQ